MEEKYSEIFWKSYSENHFWRLNDKSAVKENSFYYDAIFDELLPKDKSVNILDIGCGGGHFLHYLHRRQYKNIQGIDLAPGLVEFVKREIWPNVIQGDALKFLEQYNNKFDVLVANDFIEHLPKDSIIKFLFLCKNALTSDGKLILKTPNMSNLFASRNRYVDFTHEVGFTEHSLNEVCSAAGFTNVVILAEFLNKPEPWIYKLIRRVYLLMGESAPKILSTNLMAVCSKKQV